MTWNYVTTPHDQYLKTAILDFLHFNPCTARVFDGVLQGESNFWVCGRNPMMWPFKWKLSACTFTRCYLFLTILENEFGNLVETFLWGKSKRIQSKSEEMVQTVLCAGSKQVHKIWVIAHICHYFQLVVQIADFLCCCRFCRLIKN